jgi:hypothetical protein
MIFLLRNQHVVVSKRRLICCTSLCPHSHAHLAQLSALNRGEWGNGDHLREIGCKKCSKQEIWYLKFVPDRLNYVDLLCLR